MSILAFMYKHTSGFLALKRKLKDKILEVKGLLGSDYLALWLINSVGA